MFLELPESNTLCVRNFTRPLRQADVETLLKSLGEVRVFWMDSVKSHCFVTVMLFVVNC